MGYFLFDECEGLVTGMISAKFRHTLIGRGLLVHMVPLWMWVIENAGAFRGVRGRYDAEREGDRALSSPTDNADDSATPAR